MEITLKVKRVTVLEHDGTDVITLHVNDLPTPFPEMRYPGAFRLEARKDYGAQWCREVLGVEPEIIKVG